jgi:hypothetical protein
LKVIVAPIGIAEAGAAQNFFRIDGLSSAGLLSQR